MRNNISFFLALSFLAFSSISFAQVSEAVKKNIKERVETGNNVSITVGFIDGEKVDFFSYGKTSLENGTLVNENSVYEIGSISKGSPTLGAAPGGLDCGNRLPDLVRKDSNRDIRCL